MIRNYLKIAIRNLLKHKFISFINLFGLTVGLSCCLLIMVFILHELSYDRYHKNAENIYRVERSFNNPETGTLELGSVAPPVGPLLENDFKEIKEITRLFTPGTTTLNFEDKKFNEQNIYFADEHFFNVFDVEVIRGNPSRALTDPFSIMLTEEMAEKYFGSEDPLNKTIRLDNRAGFKVTGIYKAFPDNSHVHPQILLSFNTLKIPEIYGEEGLRTHWGNNSFFTYLLLPEGYESEKLEAQFPAFLDRHIKAGEDGGQKPSEWNSLNLTALTDIHLYSHKDIELEENGDIKRVYIFSAIALFILMIACINYMNLSTARSVLRAKEIGVRKVIGAGKWELIIQFLSESVLISWLAAILAIAITWLTFPLLNQLLGQNLSMGLLLEAEVLLPLFLVPFVVGIFSGFYPAVFLSSFQPVKVLKGLFKAGGGGVSLRQALVTLQFTISIILIISTLVVYQQLQYMQEKSLGFDREQVVTFPLSAAVSNDFEAFRNELLAGVHIKEAARSSRIPSGRLLDGKNGQINLGDGSGILKAQLRDVKTDNHFFSAYGIELLAGRTFSKEYGQDTLAFIINEAAAREFRFKTAENAIGKDFMFEGRNGKIAGVVKDFHFESLHQRILPVVFLKAGNPGNYNHGSLKISGNNVQGALAQLEKTWNAFDPDIPLEYTFLDDRFASLYQAEQRQGTVFSIFACIAIAIACLGLFGLSAFTISQRVKEIGIRKVLGAENTTIVALLSKDFLKLILIAALIAFPLAWYAMHTWLEEFAYRIDMPLWVFFVAATSSALIAFLTIGYQAIKAATANPVKNLRTE